VGINSYGSSQACTVKKLIKIKDILARIPVSRTSLYGRIKAGKFPAPTHLGGFGSFWDADEIDAWIQAHLDARETNRDSNPGSAVSESGADFVGISVGTMENTSLAR
jgi:prophage regulatory protein